MDERDEKRSSTGKKDDEIRFSIPSASADANTNE